MVPRLHSLLPAKEPRTLIRTTTRQTSVIFQNWLRAVSAHYVRLPYGKSPTSPLWHTKKLSTIITAQNIVQERSPPHWYLGTKVGHVIDICRRWHYASRLILYYRDSDMEFLKISISSRVYQMLRSDSLSLSLREITKYIVRSTFTDFCIWLLRWDLICFGIARRLTTRACSRVVEL